jgi:hypothetical protein
MGIGLKLLKRNLGTDTSLGGTGIDGSLQRILGMDGTIQVDCPNSNSRCKT